MPIEHPYLLFLGDAADQLAAKTAQGVKDWRPEWCLGQIRLKGCNADLGLEDLSLGAARERGAKSVIVGVANRGGVIAETWVDVLEGPYKGRHAGVASLGERPTFGVNAPNFEVHLFDFSGNLYGSEISVSLVKHLRDEVAFVDVPTLIAQMDRDSEAARAALATATIPG